MEPRRSIPRSPVFRKRSAGNAARSIATTQASGDTELAIARQNEQARYDIALNGVKLQSALVKEEAQTGQISRQEELANLLSSETQREDIETQHLRTVPKHIPAGNNGLCYGGNAKSMSLRANRP